MKKRKKETFNSKERKEKQDFFVSAGFICTNFSLLTARTFVRHNSTTSSLSNGVRVATSATAGDASSVGLFINSGAAFDSAEFAGTSNLLSRIAAAESSPSEGIILTSFADREQMGIVAHGQDANKSVEVLARAFKAMGEGKGLDAHRSALLAEHDSLTLQSESLLMDHLHSIAFQTTPLAAPLAGNTQGVNAATPKALGDYMNTHATGQRIVVTAAGNVNHEEVAAAAMGAFGSIPESSSFNYAGVNDTEYTGSALTLRDEACPTLCSITALKGVSATHPDALKQRVVSKIVGNFNRSIGNSNMSSYPLASSTIEEGQKSASLLHSFSHSYRSTGLIGAFSHSDRDENEDVIYFICREFIRIGHEVPTTEVKRAKLKVLREAFANAGSPQALAMDLGLQMLSTGAYQSPDALSAELDAISRDDIRSFAADHFTDTDPAVVGSGPTAFFPDLNLIRGWTYQNRL